MIYLLVWLHAGNGNNVKSSFCLHILLPDVGICSPDDECLFLSAHKTLGRTKGIALSILHFNKNYKLLIVSNNIYFRMAKLPISF